MLNDKNTFNTTYRSSIKLILPVYQILRKKSNKHSLINMNWYRNEHYQILNKVKINYHSFVYNQLPKNTLQLKTPLHIHYKIYIKRKGTDGGNIRSVIEKFVLDALVQYKLIKDDTIDFIQSDSAEYFYDKNNPRCEIFLLEKFVL